MLNICLVSSMVSFSTGTSTQMALARERKHYHRAVETLGQWCLKGTT
jgi:hypothetical protein